LSRGLLSFFGAGGACFTWVWLNREGLKTSLLSCFLNNFGNSLIKRQKKKNFHKNLLTFFEKYLII
jgi:hypothetical protein